MTAFGIEAPARPASELEVWPENWLAWQVWLDLANRWRVVAGGLGGAAYQGLDAAQAQAAMAMRGIRPKRRAAIWDGLRLMEDVALPVLNEARGDG